MRHALLLLCALAGTFCALAAYRMDSWDWWYAGVGFMGIGRSLTQQPTGEK